MAKKKDEEVAKVNEVVKQEPTALAVPQSAWGAEGLSNSDILVPKLLLMQGLSKLVGDGAASVGQIRDSLNGELMGGMVKPKEMTACEMIAFQAFKTWVIFEKKNGTDEYVKTVPIDATNEGWAINEVVNGVEILRDYCLNFYVLRPEEIKSGMAFPYCVSFRRTSSQAGKKIATMAAKLRVFNKPLAGKIINLGVTTQENEKGKFFVYDVVAGRDSTPVEVAEAYKWHETLKKAIVKVDDSDVLAEATSSEPRRTYSSGLKDRPAGHTASPDDAY